MKTLTYNTYNDISARAAYDVLDERCAYLLHVDDESECMIVLDVDTFQFVVIDCEHDAQARFEHNRAVFHASYAQALALLDGIKREIADMQSKLDTLDASSTRDDSARVLDDITATAKRKL